MHAFAPHVGSWTGSNGFRLMPDDPLHVGGAGGEVSTAAAGNLTTVTYTWSHPDDGMAEGLLAIGARDDADGAIAFWGDSWHQAPQPTVLTGTFRDGLLAVSYDYGGDWRWQISIDLTDADALVVTMENVVPAAAATADVAAGPYVAMLTELRRAG